jgi:integrase/recombinase XerD
MISSLSLPSNVRGRLDRYRRITRRPVERQPVRIELTKIVDFERCPRQIQRPELANGATATHPRAKARSDALAPGAPGVTGGGESRMSMAVQTKKEEDMRHPDKVWTDPAFVDEPLARLRDEFLRRPVTRGKKKLSPATIRKYRQDLADCFGAFERLAIPLVLGSLTDDSVARWVSDMEGRGCSASTIRGRVIGLKVFSKLFIFEQLELTTIDLLRKVARPDEPLVEKEVLTEEERERLLASYDQDTFEDARDRAIMATFMATGMRRTAVRTLPLSSYDRVTGEFTTVEKGQVVRLGKLSDRTVKFMRVYLARRPANAKTDQIWVTDRGTALSDAGLEMVFRRAKQRSTPRVHAHLLRHGMGHYLADQGLGVAEIQTVLGQKTPAMARRYAGKALDRQGARLMAQNSPIG